MTQGIHYLTVQDVLFAHFRIVGQPAEFHFDRLEEATFYQYGYGTSTDLHGQAARFATGFRKLRPFTTANRAVGFVALVAFLELNGQHPGLNDDGAYDWFAAASDSASKEAMEGSLKASAAHHGASAQAAILGAIAEYPGTIERLVEDEIPAGLS